MAVQSFKEIKKDYDKASGAADFENTKKDYEEARNHGNTRLPFGLCKEHGISLPDNATPRDAWNALKGIGITPEKVYADLRKREEEKKKEAEKIYDSENEDKSHKVTLYELPDPDEPVPISLPEGVRAIPDVVYGAKVWLTDKALAVPEWFAAKKFSGRFFYDNIFSICKETEKAYYVCLGNGWRYVYTWVPKSLVLTTDDRAKTCICENYETAAFLLKEERWWYS